MEKKSLIGPMVLNAVVANKDTISQVTQNIFNELTSEVNFYHLINESKPPNPDFYLFFLLFLG